MPVYYDEVNERLKFIEKTMWESNIAIDCSCFASYIYHSDVSQSANLCELEFDAYDKILKTITDEFPRTDKVQLLKEMFSVVYKLEEEYIQAWRKKEVLITQNTDDRTI
tara:strand:- start:31197 stop:31523 length:327 start_codon:yes stop_codon:yes gene_type:complete